MSKMERWLTLIANLSVVAGIIFLAAEMRLNTQAVQAQTRHALSEQVLEVTSWMATSAELPGIESRIMSVGLDGLSEDERARYGWFVGGVLRMWENELYQYESGLFTEEAFQARVERWRANFVDTTPRGEFYRTVWGSQRLRFDASFRSEIDRIVAQVEQSP